MENKNEKMDSSSDEILETIEDASKMNKIQDQKEDSEVKKIAKSQSEFN